MNCEHCGTGLDCPTCNANEVARLGRKIDSLKTQAKRTIFIYIPITITLTLSLFGAGAFSEIVEIIKNKGIPVPVLSLPTALSEPIEPIAQEKILGKRGLAKSFTITNAVEQVHLNVDINYLDKENKSLRLFLLNEEEFENYKRGISPEGLADSVGIQNLGYNGTLLQGNYYILFLNPTDQEISADIITELRRNIHDADGRN